MLPQNLSGLSGHRLEDTYLNDGTNTSGEGFPASGLILTATGRETHGKQSTAQRHSHD